MTEVFVGIADCSNYAVITCLCDLVKDLIDRQVDYTITKLDDMLLLSTTGTVSPNLKSVLDNCILDVIETGTDATPSPFVVVVNIMMTWITSSYSHKDTLFANLMIPTMEYVTNDAHTAVVITPIMLSLVKSYNHQSNWKPTVERKQEPINPVPFINAMSGITQMMKETSPEEMSNPNIFTSKLLGSVFSSFGKMDIPKQ